MDTSFILSNSYNQYCADYNRKHSKGTCYGIASLSSPSSDEHLYRMESILNKSAYNNSFHPNRNQNDIFYFLNYPSNSPRTNGFDIEFSEFSRANSIPGRTINSLETKKTDLLSSSFNDSEQFYVHMGFMFESIIGLLLKCKSPDCLVIPQFGTDYRNFTEAPLKRVDFAVWDKALKSLKLYELKFGDSESTRTAAIEKYSPAVLDDLKSRFSLSEVSFVLLNGSQKDMPGLSIRNFLSEYKSELQPSDPNITKISNLLIEIYDFIEMVYGANREMYENFKIGFPYSVSSVLSSELKFLSEFLYNLFEEFDPQNTKSNLQLQNLLKLFTTRLRLRVLSCLNLNKHKLHNLIVTNFKKLIAIDNAAIYEALNSLNQSNRFNNLVQLYGMLKLSHNFTGNFIIDTQLPLFSCDELITDDHLNILARLKAILMQITRQSGNVTGRFLENNASYETLVSLNKHSLEEIIRNEYLDTRLQPSAERLASEKMLLDIVRSFKASCIEEIATELEFRVIDPYLSYGFNISEDSGTIIQTYNIQERVSKLMLAKNNKS